MHTVSIVHLCTLDLYSLVLCGAQVCPGCIVTRNMPCQSDFVFPQVLHSSSHVMMLLSVEEIWSLVWVTLGTAALEVAYHFEIVGLVDSALVSGYITSGMLINPRRACAARITVVVLCVCVCVSVCSFSLLCLLTLLGIQQEVSAATAREMQ